MEWVFTRRGAPKRVNHAAAVVDGAIYSFGGYTADVDFTDDSLKIDVHRLDARNVAWERITYTGERLAPFIRFGHSVIAYGHLIYLFGGQNESTAGDSALYVFNTKTLTWTCPQTTGERPLGCDGHAACLHDDAMYIFGGFMGAITNYSIDLHSLNLSTLEWTRMPQVGEHPFYREFHTMTAAPNGDLVVFGGREYATSDAENDMPPPEDYPNNVFLYDRSKLVWRRVKVRGAVPMGRRSHAAFKHGNKMFVFGGVTHGGLMGDEVMHLNDLHALDLNNFQWCDVSCRGERPSARRRMVVCVVGGVAHMFGGTQPEERSGAGREGAGASSLQEQDDCWLLDLEIRLANQCLVRCSQLGLDMSELPWELRKRASFVPRPPTSVKRLRHRARIDRDA